MQGITREQCELLRKHVAGKRVEELGAGNGELSMLMAELGAESVTMIERKFRANFQLPFFLKGKEHWRIQTDSITAIQTTFEKYVGEAFVGEPPEVVVTRWPVNVADMYMCLLTARANAALIYIGSNTNNNASGGPDFWFQCRNRALLDYLPAFDNTMIVYKGFFDSMPFVPGRIGALRRLCGEEYAALLNWDGGRMLTWEEAETLAAGELTEEYKALMEWTPDRFIQRLQKTYGF